MTETKVSIPCGKLTLEGKYALPEGNGPFPAMVVCHPHPQMGGDMDHGVVLAICEALINTGVAALRFNFRGVGESRGKYGEGLGEQEDVRAAVDVLDAMTNIDSSKMGLAGYSFGGVVCAGAALDDDRVQLLALISAGLSEAQWKRLRTYPKPKFFVVGSEDKSVPWRALKQQMETVVEPKQFEVIYGADHGWWGFEAELAKHVVEFVAKSLDKSPRLFP